MQVYINLDSNGNLYYDPNNNKAKYQLTKSRIEREIICINTKKKNSDEYYNLAVTSAEYKKVLEWYKDH